jgi:threonine dehydrogenase-like Zn-dependent dehydrogenase
VRAVVYAGPGRVSVADVARPVLGAPDDAIVEVSLTSICGSDLHVLDGKTPGMRPGSVIGHEFTGRIVEVGDAVSALEPGTRVLGSFLIACGRCRACSARRYNLCSNRRALGLGPLTGDLDGAQAEFVRVPDASANLRPLGPTDPPDERALFCGDILATGFYACSVGAVQPGEVVAVIGAGPVGLCCALAALLRSPQRVVVLDADEQRVSFARDRLHLDAVVVTSDDAQVRLREAAGDSADVVFEAVGAVPAFKSALRCARDGGRVVVVGVYGAERYEFPMGRVWIRALNVRFAGMANVQAHWDEAMAAAGGDIDPTRLITHKLSLEQAEEGYDLFRSRRAMKVLLTP